MYDRPDLSELIDAVRMHLETAVIPAVRADRQLYFRTLVAINVLRIAGRELEMSGGQLRGEWASLNVLEGVDTPLPDSDEALRKALAARSAELSDAIRRGDYDAQGPRGSARAALFEHLKVTTTDQLMVANPRFLATLIQEAQNPDLDAWQGRFSP